ncbi:hypothetical protein D5018_18205 [Parashewanella curva]|uniref:Uncharacterized protein n=1 Tax=Parashewanella curva TaxID=2338552 RepID=A0A3L8PTY1_9GAMM|nr:hypothetical protein [Parashewanella curva]RLV58269.1 hypothetical protein D5018_18205 [Parashewanella curva]
MSTELNNSAIHLPPVTTFFTDESNEDLEQNSDFFQPVKIPQENSQSLSAFLVYPNTLPNENNSLRLFHQNSSHGAPNSENAQYSFQHINKWASEAIQIGRLTGRFTEQAKPPPANHQNNNGVNNFEISDDMDLSGSEELNAEEVLALYQLCGAMQECQQQIDSMEDDSSTLIQQVLGRFHSSGDETEHEETHGEQHPG